MIEWSMVRQPLFSPNSTLPQGSPLPQVSPGLNVTLHSPAAQGNPFVLTGEHLDLELYPAFLSKQNSDAYFSELAQDSNLKQGHLTIFGKSLPEPRETAWYGEAERSYTYSNKLMNPNDWNSSNAGRILLTIKNKIDPLVNLKFTSVLINHYRNGHDSVGWHSDDEPELGFEPFIASLSLGAERRFDLRLKSDHKKVIKWILPHGSLVIMKNKTQQYWQHQIPKQPKETKARINLTYRVIL